MLNFSDNRLVKKTKGTRGTFFSVSFVEDDLYVFRYTVPGRYDHYSFKLPTSCRGIIFSSDTNTSMRQALKMLEDDLSKENVRKMLIDAAHNPDVCGRMKRLNDLMLKLLVPKPFVTVTLEKAIKKGIEERALVRARMKATSDI